MKCLIVILLIFFTFSAEAAFWQRHDKGWHWYEPQEEVVEPKKTAKEKPIAPAKIDANIMMKQLKKDSELKLNEAMLNPTQENVLRYLHVQKKILDMASQFSARWQQVVWQNPNLDDTVKHPVSDVGQSVTSEIKSIQKKQSLKMIGADYGLFFYFDSTCPYCQKMAPTVKSFAEFYDFELFPITIDGIPLPEFPLAKKDNGSARALEVKTVPALYLINHKTKAIIPIGFGMLSFDEIEMRLITLIHDENKNKRALHV